MSKHPPLPVVILLYLLFFVDIGSKLVLMVELVTVVVHKRHVYVEFTIRIIRMMTGIVL